MTTPAQAEAEGLATVDIDWDGVTVTIPASAEDIDLDVIEAFEAGKAVTAVRALVGAKQYDAARKAYEKQNGRRPRVGDLNSLMEQVAQTFGFDNLGN